MECYPISTAARDRRSRPAHAAWLGAFLLLAATTAGAQTGEVVGVVVSSGGTGVPQAQVRVRGTSVAVATGANGQFRLGSLSGSEVTLEVRRLGFRPLNQTVRVGSSDLRLVLSEQPTSLEGIVVTGTAGEQTRREIGNVVTTISASEVAATQPVRSVQDLLTGRAAGVSVVASSGQVGTGSRIRIRGASSLSLANEPLIFVDGIRVDNSPGSGPTNQGFGSRSVSRFNDFDPDDIESIEIIKGPAAATLYGTEASNGVIQIITRRGAAGRPTWNVVARYGANWLPNWKNRLYTNYGVVNRAGGGRDTVTITPHQLNDSLRANFGEDIFRTGNLSDLQLSVSGGTAGYKYYLSANQENNEGVERENSLRRSNLRANFTISPSSRWDLQTSVGYMTSRTNLPFEAGGGGATWATYFASPMFLGGPQIGFRSGPPDIYYQAVDVYQDVDRLTGSMTMTHRPTSWFTQRLLVGRDRLNEEDNERAPRNDVIGSRYTSFSYLTGSTSGYVAFGTRDVITNTVDYSARVPLTINPALRAVTSAGAQYYGRTSRPRAFYADSFAVSGIATLALGGRTRTISNDDVIENNTVGAYLQQQLVWHDRLYVTGALRADDNSAFGTNYDLVVYPKLSASYVLSEEPALPVPDIFNTLRLRAAYGASGLQPGAFDAIRTYSLSGTGGTVTPFSPGNPDLGPERTSELELGIDAGLRDDRVAAEVTYFRGTTRDAILSRLAPPSAGFPDFQFFNAGQVNRRGLEWLVRGTPLAGERVGLDLTVSGSVNRHEIMSLGNSDTISLSSSVAHVVGYAPGGWWDRRVVAATVGADGRVIPSSRMCDNGQGGSIACASAPRVFLGSSVPTNEGAFTAGLTLFENIRVNAMFDYRGGYKKLDGNRRVRCNLFNLCRENYYPEEFDAVTLAETQGGTQFVYNLVQDASFRRFRELSLTYSLPDRYAQQLRSSRASITVAGRNLALWTNYGGLEPEASFNGGARAGFGQWEQNVLPQSRQLVTTLNLSF